MGGRFFWIDTTKNGDPLELPITDTLREMFHRRLKIKNADDVLVFHGVKGVIQETRHIIDRISAATVSDDNDEMLSLYHSNGTMRAGRSGRLPNWWAWVITSSSA